MGLSSIGKRAKQSEQRTSQGGIPWFSLYVFTVSVIGIVLIVWSVTFIGSFAPTHNLLLLAALVVVTQLVSATLPVSGKSAVTYTVSAGVTIAAIPLYGLHAAILLEALSGITIWLVKPHDETAWKKNVSQLFFNLGMICTAAFIAGYVYEALTPLIPNQAIYWLGLCWLLIGVLYDQINLLLLVVVVRLQHGPGFSMLGMWRSSWWASTVHVVNTVISGGVLVLAARSFDWLGIVVFFVPIVMSAFVFWVYVSQTKKHVDNMEQIIAERTQALEQLNREKDVFLAVLTHDMKSPLTTIGTYASMLQERPEMLLRKPQWMSNVLHAQQVLVELVDNILDLEKLQVDGNLDINRTTFNLNELVTSVVDAIRPIAMRKQIEIAHTSEHKRIALCADRFQMERVLTNLLSNAVKYTPAKGKVAVAALEDETSVGLFVVDNGYGIPEADLPHIFERYRRVESHIQHANGTGLGLAITKAIVEAHGGFIEVESQEGVGSRFMVQLPCDVEDRLIV